MPGLVLEGQNRGRVPRVRRCARPGPSTTGRPSTPASAGRISGCPEALWSHTDIGCDRESGGVPGSSDRTRATPTGRHRAAAQRLGVCRQQAAQAAPQPAAAAATQPPGAGRRRRLCRTVFLWSGDSARRATAQSPDGTRARARGPRRANGQSSMRAFSIAAESSPSPPAPAAAPSSAATDNRPVPPIDRACCCCLLLFLSSIEESQPDRCTPPAAHATRAASVGRITAVCKAIGCSEHDTANSWV